MSNVMPVTFFALHELPFGLETFFEVHCNDQQKPVPKNIAYVERPMVEYPRQLPVVL